MPSSSALSEHILNQMKAAVFLIQNSKMQYANAAAFAMTGYTEEELLDIDFEGLLHESSQEKWNKYRDACANNVQTEASSELQFTTKDGASYWGGLELTATEYEREAALLVVVSEDTQGYHSSILSKLQNYVMAMITQEFDLQDFFTTLLRHLEQYYPEIRSSVLLLEEGKFLKHCAASNLPDEYCQIIDGLEIGTDVGTCGSAAYKKSPVISADIENDPACEPFKKIAQDFNLRACYSQPIMSLDGKVLGTLAFYRSYTHVPEQWEQEMSEELCALSCVAIETQQEQKRLRSIEMALEIAGECILITDPRGVIEYVNLAFIQTTGYTSEEAVGKTPALLKSSAQDPKFYKELWQTISKGEVWSGNLIDRNRVGHFYPSMMSIAPILEDDGKISGYISIQRDVTEQHLSSRKMMDAQNTRAVEKIVNGLSHNFNNIFAGIMGNLYLAKPQTLSLPDVLSRLENAEQLSLDGSEIIQQLLIFIQKNEDEEKDFNLNKLIQNTFELNNALHHHLELCEEDLSVHADAQQIVAMFVNLLNNADDAVLESLSPSVYILLKAFKPDFSFKAQNPDVEVDRFAHIQISDNGKGVAIEHLGKIFDPFFTTKDPQQSLGMGLSLVQGIVQRYGGVLNFESTYKVGTTFDVYFPLLGSQRVSSEEELPKLPKKADRGITILAVDDDPMVCELNKVILKGMGYDVILAYSASEAISTFEKQHIDLILMDVIMPGIGGVEAARKIRKINPKVPVIFATGYDKEEILKMSEGIEHCSILKKPFSMSDLSGYLQELLANRGN